MNNKKLLCENILTKNFCSYKNRCKFAHTLQEQKKEHTREIAYNMITKDENLEHINLHENKKLYKSLLSLTKVCEKCIINKCTGGYNCKYGAISPEYQICKDDLIYGFCDDERCAKNHLTRKGLKPYNNLILKMHKISEAEKNLNESIFDIDECKGIF